ncbi:MAG: type II secretion system GspH family protein [Lentisphaeraceae bacterium]|nr:type II secretion system GspH family protein [Lentisphaeraceae bacterium]
MNKKRFTLIELLIVVAIIGVLATLLLPSLSHAREAAKMAVCMSNQAQLNNKIIFYSKDNNSEIPPYGKNKVLGNGHHTRHFMETENWSTRRNLAFLWDKQSELQTDTQTMYCPSQKNKAFMFETYYDGTKLRSSTVYNWASRLRVGYNYNIRRKADSGIPYYSKVMDMDAETILLSDLFTHAKNQMARQDIFGHSKVNGFVFLKGDGSAKNKRQAGLLTTLRTSNWDEFSELNTVHNMLNQ